MHLALARLKGKCARLKKNLYFVEYKISLITDRLKWYGILEGWRTPYYDDIQIHTLTPHIEELSSNSLYVRSQQGLLHIFTSNNNIERSIFPIRRHITYITILNDILLHGIYHDVQDVFPSTFFIPYGFSFSTPKQTIRRTMGFLYNRVCFIPC